jgi:hypothetical protein
MMSTAARSLLVSGLLFFAACAGDPADSGSGVLEPPAPPPPATDVPPVTPPPPAATAVTFACGAESLTLELPCKVGLPLGGKISAVECSARSGNRSGVITLVLDLATPANQVIELPGAALPPRGDIGAFRLVRGSVVFSRIDPAKRTFFGSLQDVSLEFANLGACQLPQGPFSGIAGNFL